MGFIKMRTAPKKDSRAYYIGAYRRVTDDRKRRLVKYWHDVRETEMIKLKEFARQWGVASSDIIRWEKEVCAT